MSGPSDDAHPLAERFAEVRGEHGWARYVDDETLAAWLRRDRDGGSRATGDTGSTVTD